MKRFQLKKVVLCCAGAGLVGLGLLQFTNPSRVNPPVAPGHDLCDSNPPPPEVAALLHEACYDCHSSETKWPWYSHIAPISWSVAADVQDGRQQLNFSEWPRDDSERQQKRLKKIARDVESGDMPLRKYTWLHTRARLTGGQREQLTNWARKEMQRLGEQK